MNRRILGHTGRLLATLLAATLLSTGLGASAQASAQAPAKAPVLPGKGEIIPGQYIVVLKDGVSARGADVARSYGVPTLRSYAGSVRGFAAKLSSTQLTKVARDSSVKYIEPDAYVHADASKPNPPADPSDTVAPQNAPPTDGTPSADGLSANAVQSGATWGIDRIDQRTGTNGAYYYTNTGAGVTAYVIDTGIYTAHTQFGGRARYGLDVIGGTGARGDCHGHGTHVAGTIGGSTYGVAKGVRLVAVRVLDCAGNGTVSGVLAGVDWVTHNRTGPSVANLSLSGGFSQSLNDAVARSIASGVTFTVAAGNSNANACSFSPASVAGAITVGATGRSGTSDVRASFSNFGSCVDLFEPGVNIVSAGRTSTTALATMSGTSMAAPHAAGLAALYLQSNQVATPSTVAKVLTTMSATGVVTDVKGSPNRLGRKWAGNLGATGASVYLPDNSSWHQSTTGYVQAWLAGQSGRDTDLYLQRWTGTTWTTVASSRSTSNREIVSYRATGGYYYRYRVHQLAGGAGSFDLWSLR